MWATHGPRRWPTQQYIDWAVGLQIAYNTGRLRGGRKLSKMLFKNLEMKLEDDERAALAEERARAVRELAVAVVA